MKRLTFLSLFTVLLAACALPIPINLPQPATPIPPVIDTPLPPSATATSNLPPTYTSTPTQIGAKPSSTPTDTPPPSSTFLLVTLPTGTLEPTEAVEAVATATLSGLEGSGFDSVEISADEFHWGSCDSTKSTMTVKVTDPAQVANVVVFVRFRNKSSGSATGWDAGSSMENKGGGTFAFTFDGDLMGVYYRSWVVYQLVGTNAAGANLVRSPVFAEALTLSPCP